MAARNTGMRFLLYLYMALLADIVVSLLQEFMVPGGMG
jgi:hypothetical protein